MIDQSPHNWTTVQYHDHCIVLQEGPEFDQAHLELLIGRLRVFANSVHACTEYVPT